MQVISSFTVDDNDGTNINHHEEDEYPTSIELYTFSSYILLGNIPTIFKTRKIEICRGILSYDCTLKLEIQMSR